MRVRLFAGELMRMRPGEILILRHPVESSATLLVGEQPLFQAFMMRHGQKRVARLTGISPKPKVVGKDRA
jgi:flagellar motor switch protein FliM